MSGTQNIVAGIDKLQNVWNDETKYGTIDLLGTLRRIFDKNQTSQMATTGPEPTQNQSVTPGFVANPGGTNAPVGTTPGNVANPMGTNSNFSPVTNPMQTEDQTQIPGVDPSKYSPNNPFVQYINRNKNSFFVRKPTPELIAALDQWEAQNKKSQQDALTEQQKADLERRYKEAQIRELDSQSRLHDRMPVISSGGSKSKHSPFFDNTMDAYYKDMSNKGAYDPKTETWTTPTGKPPIGEIDWVKQNLKPEDYTKFMKEWTGSDYSPPANVTAPVWQSPVQFNPSQGYDRQVWDGTYSDVQQFGGPGAALNYYIKNKNADPQKIKALLDRYNQAHGTKHTFAEYVKKFDKQIAAAPTATTTVAQQ